MVFFDNFSIFLTSVLNQELAKSTWKVEEHTLLVYSLTRKHVGPKFAVCVFLKTNLHTNIGGAEAQPFDDAYVL